MDAQLILPALDEADALRALLPKVPEGIGVIVVDNGSADDTAEVARGLGATVVSEPRRGFGAACWAGLWAASADIVAFMDADGSCDPADLAAPIDLVASGAAELFVGERVAARGAWPRHARVANRFLAGVLRRRTGLSLRDIGPVRVARREGLLALDLRDRTFGWPLEMVLAAHGQGWRIVSGPTHYAERVGRSKVTGTVRGTAGAVRAMLGLLRGNRQTLTPDQGVMLVVIAKEPIPGAVKTRCVPPLNHDQAARLAELALTRTLAAVGDVPAAARVLFFDGDASAWLPSGWRHWAQPPGALGDRLAVAMDNADGPVIVVGMDTPQASPALLAECAWVLRQMISVESSPDVESFAVGGSSSTASTPAPSMLLAPAADGGYWAIGVDRLLPGLFDGVPMSSPETFGAQYRRARELGYRVRLGPTLTDVDDAASALAVSRFVPRLLLGDLSDALLRSVG